MTIFLIALATLSIAVIVPTVVMVARDGYRRVPSIRA
jgi:hypothetical protein